MSLLALGRTCRDSVHSPDLFMPDFFSRLRRRCFAKLYLEMCLVDLAKLSNNGSFNN